MPLASCTFKGKVTNSRVRAGRRGTPTACLTGLLPGSRLPAHGRFFAQKTNQETTR